MQHKDLTEKIIGCAYQVYNKMGFGFLEHVYEKCLMIELKRLDSKLKRSVPSRSIMTMKLWVSLWLISLLKIQLFWN